MDEAARNFQREVAGIVQDETVENAAVDAMTVGELARTGERASRAYKKLGVKPAGVAGTLVPATSRRGILWNWLTNGKRSMQFLKGIVLLVIVGGLIFAGLLVLPGIMSSMQNAMPHFGGQQIVAATSTAATNFSGLADAPAGFHYELNGQKKPVLVADKPVVEPTVQIKTDSQQTETQMTNPNQLPPTTWQWATTLVDAAVYEKDNPIQFDMNDETFKLYVSSDDQNLRQPMENEVKDAANAIYNAGSVFNNQDTTKGTSAYGKLARDGKISIYEGPKNTAGKRDYVQALTKTSNSETEYLFISKTADGIDTKDSVSLNELHNVVYAKQNSRSSTSGSQDNSKVTASPTGDLLSSSDTTGSDTGGLV